MSPTEALPADITDAVPADLVIVGDYASAADGFAHGLVALASGQAYWLIPDEGRHRLGVEPGAAEVVREQLARYDREALRWPPAPIVDPAAGRFDLITPTVWGVATLAMFAAQASWPFIARVGAMDAQGVFARGEVWRALTALFLHGDALHALSNLVSGFFVFAAVTSTLGRARGWLLLAASAIAANLAAGAAHFPDVYRSVGASTAIFAGVGLLTGRACRVVVQRRNAQRAAARLSHASRERTRSPQSPGGMREFFLPVASGLTVLALYGAGGEYGESVDVLAHVTGFAAGLAAGVLAGLPRARSNRD